MPNPEEHRPNPKLASSAFTHLVGSFKDRISGMFDQMVDILLGMAEKSASVKDQHLYFDSMRTLRQSRGAIIEAFEKNLNDMGKNPEALAKTEKAASIETLELISDDAMNENVTLNNLAQRIANRAGDEINAFDIRIDSISSDEHVLGISPEIALRALEAALRKAALEFETRQVVYQIIEQQAVHSLANVYAEMNLWMINQGVMPSIPLGYVRRTQTGRHQNTIGATPPPTSKLRSFANEVTQNTDADFPQPSSHGMPTTANSPLHHFNPDGGEPYQTVSTDYAAHMGASTDAPLPSGGAAYSSHGSTGGFDSSDTHHWPQHWPQHGEISELHVPWLSQQIDKLKSHQQNPITHAIARISPALNAAASHDLSILHDRRHPMRRALTLLEDLIIDLDSNDNMDDIGGEITQMISLMEARAASGPGFWLHVVKYLNYLKEELHTRLWSDDVDVDHQERVNIARRLATRQIQLMMRDKRVTTALQFILTQALGPALAILMLRHRHDRDSQVLKNALQLIHDVIESVQELPDSIESMHYLEHASGKALIQRLDGFFMGFSGFNQAVIAETLHQLEQEHSHLLNALEARNGQVILPVFSAHIAQGSNEETHKTLHLPALPSQPPGEDIEIAEFVETTSTRPEHPVSSSTEPVMADEIQPTHDIINEPPSTASSPAALGDSASEIEADLTALNSLALDALLEKLMREHRFTWFQVPACEGCNLRRLMFGAYDHARRLVTFCNVRQEPSLNISVVDFDLGLKTGTTRPIYNEPEITRLLTDYLKSCAASG